MLRPSVDHPLPSSLFISTSFLIRVHSRSSVAIQVVVSVNLCVVPLCDSVSPVFWASLLDRQSLPQSPNNRRQHPQRLLNLTHRRKPTQTKPHRPMPNPVIH